jgi:uncharacterized ParB-like nuclease family protein
MSSNKMRFAREFNRGGPCSPLGLVVRETAGFFVYYKWLGVNRYSARERRVSKTGRRAHVEPCPGCRDYTRTIYPNGYTD